jgi:hypothetical protein
MPVAEMFAGMLWKQAFPGFGVLGGLQPEIFGQSGHFWLRHSNRWWPSIAMRKRGGATAAGVREAAACGAVVAVPVAVASALAKSAGSITAIAASACRTAAAARAFSASGTAMAVSAIAMAAAAFAMTARAFPAATAMAIGVGWRNGCCLNDVFEIGRPRHKRGGKRQRERESGHKRKLWGYIRPQVTLRMLQRCC